MSFRMEIRAIEPRFRGIEDPEKEEFLKLVDEWCERVESGARSLCADIEAKNIQFYRDGKSITVKGSGLAAVDCLMQVMVKRSDSMDTSLTGVYEAVLSKLQAERKKLRQPRKK